MFSAARAASLEVITHEKNVNIASKKINKRLGSKMGFNKKWIQEEIEVSLPTCDFAICHRFVMKEQISLAG